jgi:hypothetical protein
LSVQCTYIHISTQSVRLHYNVLPAYEMYVGIANRYVLHTQ